MLNRISCVGRGGACERAPVWAGEGGSGGPGMMQQPGRQPPRKRFASQQKRKPPVKIAPLDTRLVGVILLIATAHRRETYDVDRGRRAQQPGLAVL